MFSKFISLVAILASAVAVATMIQASSIPVYAFTGRSSLPGTCLPSCLNVVGYCCTRICWRHGVLTPTYSGKRGNAAIRPAPAKLRAVAFRGTAPCPPFYLGSYLSPPGVPRLSSAFLSASLCDRREQANHGSRAVNCREKCTECSHPSELSGFLTLDVDPSNSASPFLIIGRTAEQNERLTFVTARPTDWWFHVEGLPGAHVVLRGSSRDWRPSQHDIQLAANCAAYFSKARDSSVPVRVTFTLAKNVSKPRRSPVGTVQVVDAETTVARPSAVKDILQRVLEERRQSHKKKNVHTKPGKSSVASGPPVRVCS
ncbi:fibronectin-binding a domain protein [Cystoisospora suis]|uniref:Fibronectin-binding a domain protein n=1 Tax=Cystoisospora suis TaxID=483139 RepID=A0A2C6KHR9_9APIC|nr:fibronectin-binding a domain protein [Cystoisospora suis]